MYIGYLFMIMNLHVFLMFPVIVVCRCQMFAAPMLDHQHVPLSALINVSAISAEILRILEEPIKDLITSTVKTQVEPMKDLITSTVKSQVEPIKDLITSTVKTQVEPIKDLITSTVKTQVEPIKDLITSTVKTQVEPIKDLITSTVKTQVEPIKDLITSTVKTQVDKIKDLITSTVKIQVDILMDQVRDRDLEVIHEYFNNTEKELKKMTENYKALESNEKAIMELKRIVENLNVSERNGNESESMELKSLVESLKVSVNEIEKNVFPSDCVYIEKSKGSGIYTLLMGNQTKKIQVFCEMEKDGGGWTVFQRRIDGRENFTRAWEDYENGFGDLQKEFWFGNSKLHTISSRGHYELRVDLEDFGNNTKYAKYSSFSVGGKDTNYILTVGGFSGDNGDSLSYHNGRPFTTIDQDNDDNDRFNCAQKFKGGWWYGYCHHSNLNGLYFRGNHSFVSQGVNWRHWTGNFYSLKSSTMMIRKVK